MKPDRLAAIDVRTHAERRCPRPHDPIQAGFKPDRREPILKTAAARLLFGDAGACTLERKEP